MVELNMQKRIKEVLEGINILKFYAKKGIDNILNTPINGVKYNSKKISQGDVFVCLQGRHTDGIFYIDEAIKNGAICIVFDKEIKFDYENVLGILVNDTSDTLAKLASNFYDHPSKKLLLIGVTGTNGKTTVTYLLESIFKEAGYNPGVIGTINYRFNNNVYESPNTTPFASDLQKLLFDMYNSGVNVVIMEVSSHSLVQKRVLECEFDVGIFTNLSQEHLDYHKTMQDYFDAKSILFKSIKPEKKEIFKNSEVGKKVCVINFDDYWGKKLVELCNDKETILYTKGSKNGHSKNKFKAVNTKYFVDKTQFEIVYNKNRVMVETQLLGEFNVYNILAAFATAYSQGIKEELIVEGIKKLSCIPGRLEKISTPNGYTVIIDYAHTPDALQKVIYSLKQLPHKRLIVVFGCGGDRDRSKRPVMGTIATTLADYVIVTSDNPRTEDPQKIILDIEVGIKKSGKTNYEIVVDRKEAIFKALSLAKSEDIVLLAGKGHENYQIIGEKKYHFDEREIVSEFLTKEER
jgi:UDP-N-acetylmuramoyl-L-alanyl-D-glutamate--2,6-diaminopimelate ligase